MKTAFLIMQYDIKHQVIVKGGFEELSISLQYDTDPDDLYPVLLYIPDKRQPEHHHIHLDSKTALILNNWLTRNTHVK